MVSIIEIGLGIFLGFILILIFLVLFGDLFNSCWSGRGRRHS